MSFILLIFAFIIAIFSQIFFGPLIIDGKQNIPCIVFLIVGNLIVAAIFAFFTNKKP